MLKVVTIGFYPRRRHICKIRSGVELGAARATPCRSTTIVETSLRNTDFASAFTVHEKVLQETSIAASHLYPFLINKHPRMLPARTSGSRVLRRRDLMARCFLSLESEDSPGLGEQVWECFFSVDSSPVTPRPPFAVGLNVPLEMFPLSGWHPKPSTGTRPYYSPLTRHACLISS